MVPEWFPVVPGTARIVWFPTPSPYGEGTTNGNHSNTQKSRVVPGTTHHESEPTMTTTETPLKITELSALIVHPGDTLILTARDWLASDEFDQLQEQIGRHLPDGVHTLIVHGLEVHGIRPATTTEGDNLVTTEPDPRTITLEQLHRVADENYRNGYRSGRATATIVPGPEPDVLRSLVTKIIDPPDCDEVSMLDYLNNFATILGLTDAERTLFHAITDPNQ